MRYLVLIFAAFMFFNCKPDNPDDGGNDPTPTPSVNPSDSTTPTPTVTPTPSPVAIKLEVPSYYVVKSGTKIAIQVKPQADVTYVWSTGATGPKIWVTPTATTTYLLSGLHKDGRVVSTAVEVRVN